MEAQDDDNSWWLGLWGLLGCSLIALGLIVVYGLLVRRFFADWSDSGPFGDSFGAITAFFTALAFAGLILTMLIQKQELKLQRQELALLRQEQAGSREQLENQFNVMARQSFDNNFFNLMSAVRDLQESCGPADHHGRYTVSRIIGTLLNGHEQPDLKPCDVDKEAVLQELERQSHTGVSYYLNQLSRLWLYVHKADIQDKFFYYELIVAESHSSLDKVLILISTDAEFSDLIAAVDEYRRLKAEVNTP